MNPNLPQTWDVFCRVIDNYGDIGVCWRLARQLAHDYEFQVRLWVDDMTALNKIWPDCINEAHEIVDRIEVRLWQTDFAEIESSDVEPYDVEPYDVVVEAFACTLPDHYLRAMKKRKTPSHWFNLEYLSAEDWVESCHGLPSMHPQLGLQKIFFFPGFTNKTGGLLKERALLVDRDNFQLKGEHKIAFLNQLGVTCLNHELVISLFSYENEAIGSLLTAWAQSSNPILSLIPAGKILSSINSYLGTSLVANDELVLGNCRLRIIPFLSQTDYDRLLWSSDINFVRGEDSFVRAQWAGKPFIWHIYPQEDEVHMAKLDAFLDRFMADKSMKLRQSLISLWHDWNRGLDCSTSWNRCLANLPTWQKQSRDWSHHLNSLGDLTSNMVQFCQKTL